MTPAVLGRESARSGSCGLEVEIFGLGTSPKALLENIVIFFGIGLL